MSEPVDETHPSSATDVPTTSNAEHGQDSPETPKKRKRRWLGFSLSTFLLLVTAFCVWLGLLVHRVNKQKDAVQWVQEQGGRVVYDFQTDEHRDWNVEPELPGPDWLREIIGLDYFADVVSVEFHSFELDHIEPLSNLPDLRRLFLNGNVKGPKIADLTPLSKLDQLEELTLNFVEVSDLRPLQNLSKLEELTLGPSPVADLQPLKQLRRLRILRLNDTEVMVLSPLQALTELRHLEVSDTLVSDLRPLRKLTRLENLVLSATSVKGLTALQELERLENLNLDNTQVSDLTPLHGLTRLADLWLAKTPVSDLGPLRRFSRLERLGLESTAVVDLEPLRNLTHLKELLLGNTQVTDLRPLVGLGAVEISIDTHQQIEIPDELKAQISRVEDPFK